MTVYARSDLVHVFVSDAHGGCGASHSRPVENGAPVKLWSLAGCSCEDHLRHDSHWSTTIPEIPETYDENKAREDFEKRGALDERRLMALALARMTGLDLPETMLAAIGGGKSMVPGPKADLLCPSGHANFPGQDFCGKCGTPLHGPDPAHALEAPQNGGGNGTSGDGLMGLHHMQLAKMCREAGLDDTGGKADMVARLQETAAV